MAFTITLLFSIMFILMSIIDVETPEYFFHIQLTRVLRMFAEYRHIGLLNGSLSTFRAIIRIDGCCPLYICNLVSIIFEIVLVSSFPFTFILFVNCIFIMRCVFILSHSSILIISFLLYYYVKWLCRK